MQKYKDQITVNVDRVPSQPITNLEAGSPAVGIAFTGNQPTALKITLVVGGICGLTGLGIGTVIGANQQNYQLDRAQSELVQIKNEGRAQQREIQDFCSRNVKRKF